MTRDTAAMTISAETLEDFARTLLEAGGLDLAQADTVARNLVWNEMIGRGNFGFLRLPLYLERLARGGISSPCTPRFEQRDAAVACMDADNAFGQYAGTLAMERAIALAGETGTGVVAVRNSNFFGTGAWFVNLAASRGMLGIAMSNAFPKVAAHGGTLPVFGTNPFAFGAPRRHGEPLMVDMATSGLAGSTVRQHRREGTDLPEGLAVNADGTPLTDPDALGAGALLPFGGAKGYGLALMVEILAGVLTGAGVSRGVSSMYEDVAHGGDNGHLMIAIDIARFLPLETYHDRLEGLIASIRSSAGAGEVLLPGELRWRTFRDSERDGVALSPDAIEALETAARDTGVAVPWAREAKIA